MTTEQKLAENVIWRFLREAEPGWESGKCAIYAEDLACRLGSLLRRAKPVKENVGGFAGAVMRFLDEINPMVPATHEEASHD